MPQLVGVNLALAILLAGAAPLQEQAASASLLQPGDRVALLGNTFAERLRLHGHFETALYAAMPAHRLVVRNLAWSADEVALRPRPLNFGGVEEHLRDLEIDVALLFYGANEAFAGEAGIEDWKVGLAREIEALGALRPRGVPLRLVLVSPIPREDHASFARLPDPAAANRDLLLYAQAMRAVAIERGVAFVDLYEPVRQAFLKHQDPLTLNGMHLTEEGDQVVSRLLVEALTGVDLGRVRIARGDGVFHPERLVTAERPILFVDLDSAGDDQSSYQLLEGERLVARAPLDQWRTGVPVESASLERAEEELRRLVVRKNRLFFDRYRAVNGYYIYGERRRPFGVENFPGEMARFDELVAALDLEVQRLARPGRVSWQLLEESPP